jgi:hypothetical protein
MFFKFTLDVGTFASLARLLAIFCADAFHLCCPTNSTGTSTANNRCLYGGLRVCRLLLLLIHAGFSVTVIKKKGEEERKEDRKKKAG